VRLAVEVNRALDARGLSQAATATLLGITQPEVSELKGYKLDGIPAGQLMHFLMALGRDVEIRISAVPRRRSRGRIHVEAA
jgi:predicted XRE-type DNA-binding protein